MKGIERKTLTKAATTQFKALTKGLLESLVSKSSKPKSKPTMATITTATTVIQMVSQAAAPRLGQLTFWNLKYEAKPVLEFIVNHHRFYPNFFEEFQASSNLIFRP